MKRRGFLGLMGGALAAGPSMAREAAAQLSNLSLPTGLSSGGRMGGQIAGYSSGIASSLGQEPNEDEWLRERIAELAGMTKAQKQERMRHMRVYELDADLQANRSFSLSAKIYMQKARDLERELANEHRSLTWRLTEYLKRQALS